MYGEPSTSNYTLQPRINFKISLLLPPALAALVPSGRQHALLPRFKGVCLVAPAIQGNPPPLPVVTALRYLVVPLIPKWQIPNALETGELENGAPVPCCCW